MSKAEQMAAQLLKSVQDMIDNALQPFDEQERRTAALLAQTRAETERETLTLHNTINSVAKVHRDRLGDHDSRIHALAKRLELLESGRTGNVRVAREVSPGAYEVQFKPKDVVFTGHAMQRHGPPPGVPAVPIGSGGNERAIDRAFDPTTANLERMTAARDAALDSAVSGIRERDALKAEIRELRERLEKSGRAHAAAQAGIEAHEKTIAKHRNEGMRKLDEATAMIEQLAIACNVQPIGSREQNTEAVLKWIKHQAGTCDCPGRPGTYDIAHKIGCPEACTCGVLKEGEAHKIGCPEMPF